MSKSFCLKICKHNCTEIEAFQRFLPSDFGNDVNHAHIEEPAKTAFDIKIKIRRMIEREQIPYSFVSCNFFAGWSLPNLSQYGATDMPTDKVLILGDGNTKDILIYFSFVFLMCVWE